jgi:hypothetical protein
VKRLFAIALVVAIAACGSSTPALAPTPTPVATTPAPSPTSAPTPTPTPISTPTPPSTFTISGTVTDATSGGILPGIAVAITAGANAGQSMKTDATGGNYGFSGISCSLELALLRRVRRPRRPRHRARRPFPDPTARLVSRRLCRLVSQRSVTTAPSVHLRAALAPARRIKASRAGFVPVPCAPTEETARETTGIGSRHRCLRPVVATCRRSIEGVWRVEERWGKDRPRQGAHE